MQIIWSDFADSQLDEIFEHYKEQAGIRVAKKHLKSIVLAPNLLSKNPEIGQKEELLEGRDIEYRYFLFKSYKLIYSVDSKKGFIKIADVFDTRQYPPKIKRKK